MRIYSGRSIKAEYKLYYSPFISSWKKRKGGEWEAEFPQGWLTKTEMKEAPDEKVTVGSWWCEMGRQSRWIVEEHSVVDGGTWESLIRKLMVIMNKTKMYFCCAQWTRIKKTLWFWRLYIALNLPQTDRRCSIPVKAHTWMMSILFILLAGFDCGRYVKWP